MKAFLNGTLLPEPTWEQLCNPALSVVNEVKIHYADAIADYYIERTSMSNNVKCLYCERFNPQGKFRCDGCGASLHVIR